MDRGQLERQENLEDFHPMLDIDVRGVLSPLARQIIADARKYVSSCLLWGMHLRLKKVM